MTYAEGSRLAAISATGHAGSDKVRRKTHLPRDPHGFIRVQWLENFYETLYASNERDIHIPFTVVFQYRRIYAAYYTDADGYVQKIDKLAELGPEQVMDGLKDLSHGANKDAGSHPQPQPIPGCRAYYIYSNHPKDPVLSADPTVDLSVEFFDDASLAHFLTYRGKENNGIVQQFQELTTTAVSTVRAYWTPHYCSLESRINVHPADAAHVPVEQRAVTFEGELHHSAACPLSGKVQARINAKIDRIVSYMSACLPGSVRIQLMILNFRIGYEGKVWFLFCSSLRLFDNSLESIGLGREQSLRPSSARLVEASLPPRGVRGARKRVGLMCPSTDTRLRPFDASYRVSVQKVAPLSGPLATPRPIG